MFLRMLGLGGLRAVRGGGSSLLTAAGLAALLAGCGGSETPASAEAQAAAGRASALSAPMAAESARNVAALLARGNGSSLGVMPALVLDDASRLAQQASFGPSEALINEIRSKGNATWITEQLALNVSRYTAGQGDAIHKNTSEVGFCDQPAHASDTCWRDWYSTEPLQWDFYRNAVGKPDQLRQRVAFALSQLIVVSGYEVQGTYGFRYHHNTLLSSALGNYRDILRKTVLSPVMGQYLDHVNNDPVKPNENFARELLQLFAISPCKLSAGGALAGGSCKDTYDNELVRNYAFAMTGWTYPPGGTTAGGCYPTGANCEYMGGDMVAAGTQLRNMASRKLLSNVTVPANATAPQALEKVLDSLMNHPNMAPYISKRLIQYMTTSNPTGAYTQRVGKAFVSGRFTGGGRDFGSGLRGDMAATVAAILLDPEARGNANTRIGHLREPVLLFTGALRALGGTTDGEPFGYWLGDTLRQRVFNAPSVFNFYQADYPVAGTTLVGPEFGIFGATTALERLNYLTYLFDWGGSAPNTSIPGATGTFVNLQPYESLASDAAALVDNLSLLALGRKLSSGARTKVITAVSYWTAQTDATNWRRNRVAAAAYLVFASPEYAVQR